MSLFKSTKQQEICPQCGGELHIKRGKQGLFLGCSNYPECNYLKPLNQANHVIKTLDELCPECGQFLQIKQGNFGLFIGCSHYPECHFIVHEQEENEEKVFCPACRKHPLVARKGRTGKTFYGCRGFPECKFTLAFKPIQQSCPKCGFSVVVEKKYKNKWQKVCANKTCEYILNDDENKFD